MYVGLHNIYVLLFVDSSEDSLQHCTNRSSTEAASQARLSPKTKTVVIPVSKTVGSERLLGEADSNKLLAVTRHQWLLVATIM